MPIWYCIFKQDFVLGRWSILTILKVIPCTTADLDIIWKREVQPFIDTGVFQVTTTIITREPSNPFKDFKNEAL